jgi:hypothetical protein
MSDFTVKQYLEGIVSDEIKAGLSGVNDPIRLLSTQKIEHVNVETVSNYVFKDLNEFTQTDNKGVISGNTHIASLRDRAYTLGKFTFPSTYKIGYSVPVDMANQFGITPESLNMNADEFQRQNANNMQGISDALQKHVVMPAMKKLDVLMMEEVRDLFRNMGTASATAWQKPLGLKLVGDASDRPNNWNYTNKLTSPLNDSSMRAITNLLASGQKNELNNLYGTSIPYMILHASDYALAGEKFMPEMTVNVNYRDSTGVLRSLGSQKAKMIGVYSDADHPDDFVVLAEDCEIVRLCYVDKYGRETDGIWTRMYVDQDTGNLIYEVSKRSIMVARSPIGIIKSIVPTE